MWKDGNPLFVSPQCLEMEQAVLGSLLVAHEVTDTVVGILRAEDFYNTGHRRIFCAILDLVRERGECDLLMVAEELQRRGQTDDICGLTYLETCIDSVPTAAHVEHYASAVAGKALLRRLISTSQEIAEWAYREDGPPREIADRAERAVFGLARDGHADGLKPLAPTIMEQLGFFAEASDKKAFVRGVTTGFADLDKVTAGLRPGTITVVGAVTSMGKTALCLNMAHAAAKSTGGCVAIFSLEMTRTEIAQRLICMEARVNLLRAEQGDLNEVGFGGSSDLGNLTRAIGVVGDLNLYVDDSAGITPMQIRARARRLAATGDLKLVVVDYLQLLTPDVAVRDNRHQEISEISRGLKNLARELGVPVVVLSQLSRKVSERRDPRPLVSDLRESSSIEADADLVILVHRPRYFDKSLPEPVEGEIEEAELIIGKQRNGPQTTVKVGFQRHYARFDNLARWAE